ncbi:HDOD domain-containing protein [Undibacterium sp. RTI2.1]|uniref:HDOD domain-containing protein n=1 Tax=unclassified Undibacterium TaxID=2630295 RepID=UPI002B223FC5|nr:MULTISPECIES: HDOD domain-containing protein [unclassified Undibacterium]MEB0033075.1 HDOD domain-containing protein [Undibacterium sp. RTI2.1]MEB0118713.1 HDOD domain-containing protein [Undibacterium sp. RTI2.2]
MPIDTSVNLEQNAPEIARDRLLRKIAEDATLPTLGAVVSKVVEITSSGEDSIAKLAHFVLADVALTQKILRLSNTIHYRTRATVPVTTISRAIFLLGFDTVKTGALAMLLVDCFKDKKHAQSVRKELVHALCASIVGRELAQRSHYQDAEEAAVAALFKNIGRVLVASFDHVLYGRIQAMQISGQANAADASSLLLGCSYDRFGEMALQDWKIPDTIIQSLGALPAGEQKKASHRNEWLKQVATFSDGVASLVLTTGTDNLSARCKPLLQKFGKVLELDQAKLEEMLARVTQETRQLAESMDIALPAAGDIDETLSADGEFPSEFLLKSFNADQMQQAERYASGKPRNARDLLLAGVQDVTQMLASDQIKLNDMILLVLETLYSSMGFRFATVCLRDPSSSSFMARVSVGELYAERQRGFVFPMKVEQDVFHLAMTNNADLMISDATAPKIQKLLPSWHRALLPDALSFIVLPLVIQKKALGFFYADRAIAAEEGVPPDETALIKTLKSQLLAAMMRG